MRDLIKLALCAGSISAGWQAHAATFKTIGSIAGGPAIGAVSDTTLYGVVAYSGNGFLFSMPIAGGAATTLHNFNGTTDGSAPDGRLARNYAGALYGATPGGGANGDGTLWEYTAQGKFTVLHAFGANGDGAAPMQGPTLGAGGIVYGATGEGAIGGSGNIFKLTRPKTYDVMYEFMSMGDGHCPFSGLAYGPGGVLYGTTVGVGFGGNPTGSVWSYSPANGLKTLYVFQNGADGEWPTQAPVVDGAGNVYGVSSTQNGTSYAGAIWKISAIGHFSILHAMAGATDGYAPNSPLLMNADGLLYGTTGSGGVDGYGTVFSISKSGAFNVVHSFTAGADGAQPTGNLVQSSAGVIYGGTAYGAVFSITP
jgi:uncharacterized repeat protein (TIGR03803 family)